MSISVTTDVHCDGCGQWTGGAADLQRAAPGGARIAARQWGWICNRSGDWCPTCAATTTPTEES